MLVCRQIHDILDGDSECADDVASIESGSCMGTDTGLMSHVCIHKATPVLNLDPTDVIKSTSAWTAIHEACVAITDEVCDLAWYLWHKLGVVRSLGPMLF